MLGKYVDRLCFVGPRNWTTLLRIATITHWAAIRKIPTVLGDGVSSTARGRCTRIESERDALSDNVRSARIGLRIDVSDGNSKHLLAGGSLDDLLLLLHLTSWKGRSRYDDGEAAGRGGKPRRTGGSSNDALLLAEVGRRALHALALLTRDESCAEVLCSRGLVRTLLTHLGPYAGSALAPTDALTDQRTLLSLLDVLAASNGCGT